MIPFFASLAGLARNGTGRLVVAMSPPDSPDPHAHRLSERSSLELWRDDSFLGALSVRPTAVPLPKSSAVVVVMEDAFVLSEGSDLSLEEARRVMSPSGLVAVVRTRGRYDEEVDWPWDALPVSNEAEERLRHHFPYVKAYGLDVRQGFVPVSSCPSAASGTALVVATRRRLKLPELIDPSQGGLFDVTTEDIIDGAAAGGDDRHGATDSPELITRLEAIESRALKAESALARVEAFLSEEKRAPRQLDGPDRDEAQDIDLLAALEDMRRAHRERERAIHELNRQLDEAREATRQARSETRRQLRRNDDLAETIQALRLELDRAGGCQTGGAPEFSSRPGRKKT